MQNHHSTAMHNELDWARKHLEQAHGEIVEDRG
jgi:hypothetical protein